MTVKIQLTKGYVTVVDDQDADLAEYNWCALKDSRQVYAKRVTHNKTILLHRVVLERKMGRPLSRGIECDHKDGNGLNNQRSNLRPSTKSQNQVNSRDRKRTSCFRGVSYNGYGWVARIGGENCRTLYLGTFTTEKDAASAYNKAAQEMFGPFARLNKVE